MANIKLSWTGDASGIYEIEYKVGSDSSWIVPSSSPISGLEVTLNNLLDNTDYTFRVREYCTAGPLSLWVYNTFRTPTSTCIAPTALVSSGVSETTTDVTWTVAASAIGGYYVEYKADGTSTWLSSVLITGNHYTITGLTSGVGYQWRVKSICASGGQATSGAKTFTTVAILPQCAAITTGGVSISSNGSNYVATYSNTGGTPSTHLLEYSVDGGTSWGNITSVFAQTTVSATYNLPGGAGVFPVSHKLRVTPKCADNSTGVNAIGTFTAPTTFTQFVTFQNRLDTGSITSINIDSSPNILSSPITVGGNKDWNQTGLLGASHTITGILSGVVTGTKLKTSHIRGSSMLFTGNSIYNGSIFTLISNRTLANQDIIKVERDNSVSINGTLKIGVNDYTDHCSSQGMGFFKLSLAQSYSSPITLQIAYVVCNAFGTGCVGYGGDIVPSSDPYKAMVSSATFYPAEVTIPANTTIYNNSSSTTYSSNSLVFLRKDGQVLNLDEGQDLVGEHGQTLVGYPNCNPTYGNYNYRIYYKVLSPISGLTINLSALTDDVAASRITLIKV